MAEPVGDTAIESGRQLERDKRSLGVPQTMEEHGIQYFGCIRAGSYYDLDACLAEQLAASRSQRVRVSHGGDHPRYARSDDGVGARRLLAMMRAGLEGDDQRRPSSPITCICQRHSLSVPVAILRMPSFAYDFTIFEHHRTDERIMLNSPPTSQRQIEGTAHRLLLVHPALEAHSQAEAGEELSFGGIEILEFCGQLLVLASLISHLCREPHD